MRISCTFRAPVLRLSPLPALRAAVAVLPLLLAATPARAQDPDQDLRIREEITVTATRHEQLTGSIGTSVTVVTAADIAASGARWLTDVLALVPGVTTVSSGGAGALSGLFVRGTNSNHTLVLVNGLKVNSPTTSDYNLANLPASLVARVEVLRGPQSSLYGSDAIGGVVNIVTRRAAGPARFELSSEAGAQSSGRFHALAQGQWGGVDASLAAECFRTDGISAADSAAGNLEPDAFENRAVDARVGYQSPAGWRAEGFATAFNGRTDIDGYDFLVGPADDLDQLQRSREISAGVRVALDRGRWRGELTASQTDQKLGTVDPDGFYTAFDLDASIRELDFQNRFRLGRGHSLTVGVEARREQARSLSTSADGDAGFDQTVGTTGLYAEHRFSRGSVDLSAGMRLEDHERFGQQTTFRLTGSWRASQLMRAHGSVGTGFRAPNFNELFYPGFGNPTLGPETSTGWDLGATMSLARGRALLDLTWFRNDLDGLVAFTFPDGFVNLGRALARGVEATARWRPRTDLELQAAYTLTDSRDRGADVALLRRPRHQASVAVRLRPHERLRLYAEVRYKGTRTDVAPAGVVELPAYLVVDASARYALTGDVELTARMQNLTDSGYQEVFGFGTFGRRAFAGLRVSWSGS